MPKVIIRNSYMVMMTHYTILRCFIRYTDIYSLSHTHARTCYLHTFIRTYTQTISFRIRYITTSYTFTSVVAFWFANSKTLLELGIRCTANSYSVVIF